MRTDFIEETKHVEAMCNKANEGVAAFVTEEKMNAEKVQQPDDAKKKNSTNVEEFNMYPIRKESTLKSEALFDMSSFYSTQ